MVDDLQARSNALPVQDPLPNVRVNQVGYLPNNLKRATIVHPSTAPLTWELHNDTSVRVATGVTSVFGTDTASGDHVHTADFSSFTTAGNGYTLRVGDAASHAFAIKTDLYRQLKYDALGLDFGAKPPERVRMSDTS